jgi:hypothetical protein
MASRIDPTTRLSEITARVPKMARRIDPTTRLSETTARVPKMARGIHPTTGLSETTARVPKIARRIHCCQKVYISFALPASLCCEECVCIYRHILESVKSVSELPLIPNNNVSEKILHKSAEVRSADWIFIIGVQAWR